MLNVIGDQQKREIVRNVKESSLTPKNMPSTNIDTNGTASQSKGFIQFPSDS